MKRFLVFFVCCFIVLGGFITLVRAEPQSRPVSNGSKCWVEVGEIISADIFVSDPSCGNRGEKLHDDNENTYSVIVVNQRAYFEFPYGGGTVWKNCTVSDVENDVKRFHPSWTRDQTCLSWPRGSSGSGCQPSNETDWPAHQWKQLLVSQFLVVPSGTTYYNFTSQGTNTNQIVTIKNATLITTATVWIWTTVNSKLYNYDPNYEKITLSPGSNTNPQQEEQGWIYSSIPAYGFSTGWVEIEINGSFVDFKQSCLNPLVVENNSGNSIRIRYKQTTTSDPYYKRQLVSIYGSGNSLQSIKTVYANEVGVTVSQLSVRKIFPN